MTQDTGKKLSLKKSIMWNTIGSLFYFGCQWLMSILVIKLSGIDDGGTLSLAMSVCNIWYSIALYGMFAFEVSDTEGKFTHREYLVSRYITSGISLLGCLIYILVLNYSATQNICILLFFVIRFTEAMENVYSAIFQLNWRLDIAAKSMLMRGFLTISLFIGMLSQTKNLALTIGVIAACCLAVILLYDARMVKKVVPEPGTVSMSKIWKLLVECLPLAVYSIMANFIATVPRLFMESLLGNYKLGIYGSIAAPTVIIQMLSSYIFNPYITVFAEAYNNNDEAGFKKAVRKCLMAIAGISALAIGATIVLGKWALGFLYNSDVAAHSYLLLPLIIISIFVALNWLLCGVLTVIRSFKIINIANTLAVVISSGLSYVLEKKMDMQGANAAVIIAMVIEVLILAIGLRVKTGQKFRENTAQNTISDNK